jgi:hypothetical protein
MPNWGEKIPENAVVLIKGEVIVPTPVETVIDYVLPDGWHI